jgi:3-dehydroquinate synthase
MLETFKISSSTGEYLVEIGLNLEETKSLKKPADVVIVDQNVANLWFEGQAGDALLVEALEENKTLEGCAKLIEGMRSKGASRGSHLYSIGGGIVQDLSTFCASAYMRGIKWTYVPTTLLGMVDSCIGGKSSINVGPYKNIAGNFYPPQKILIDIKFCKTLALTEQMAGLCEAVKICFAASGNEFEDYLKIFSGSSSVLSEQEILQVVILSLHTKKRFIEEDEFDNGSRLLLNFGHTFGHAIEAATNFSITHGLAVGIGMLAEIQFGNALSHSQNTPDRVVKLGGYIKQLLATLPKSINCLKHLDVEAAMRAFKSDKKHSAQEYVVVVANASGYLERVRTPICSQTDELIRGIFSYLKEGFISEIQ